jgi:hypothetical protein
MMGVAGARRRHGPAPTSATQSCPSWPGKPREASNEPPVLRPLHDWALAHRRHDLIAMSAVVGVSLVASNMGSI